MRSEVARMGDALSTLRNAVAGAFVVKIVTELTGAAKSAVETADSFLLLKARLSLLVEEGTSVNAVLAGVAEAAARARVPAGELAAVYLKNAAAIKQMGKSQEEGLAFAESLAKVIKISGVSAQESAAAMYQLSQALSSDRLQGDEFRSVAENLPELLRILQRETGKSAKELRALAEAGALSGKVVLQAILNAQAEINERFKQVPVTAGEAAALAKDTFTQELSKATEAAGVSKAWAAVFDDIKNAMAGEDFKAAMKFFAEALKSAADNTRTMIAALSDAKLEVKAWTQAISETEVYKTFAAAIELIAKAAEKIPFSLRAAVDPLTALKEAWRLMTGGADMPTPLDGVAKRAAEIKADLEAVAAWRTETRTEEPLKAFKTETKKPIELGPTEIDKLIQKEQLQQAIQRAEMEGNKAAIEDAKMRLELHQKISYEMRRDQAGAAAQLEANIRLTAELEKQAKVTEQNRALGESFARTFTDAIRSAVTEGKNLGQTFKAVLARMLEMTTQALVLDPLMKSIGNSFAKSLGGRDLTGDATSFFSNLLSGAGSGFAFASGTVLAGPSSFSAPGIKGVAGEAGPEAVMPLRRDSSGRLGVSVAGGAAAGPTNVYFNVAGDATAETIEKMRAMAESVFAQRSPALVRESVGAVRSEHIRDKNFLRR